MWTLCSRRVEIHSHVRSRTRKLSALLPFDYLFTGTAATKTAGDTNYTAHPVVLCGSLSSVGRYKKIKFSHTRYQALGPELIPVYRQSAHRWLSHPTAIGCHYFPTCLRSTSHPKTVTVLWPVASYTAWWQRHRCEQIVQGCYADDHCKSRTHEGHDLHDRSPTQVQRLTAKPCGSRHVC